MSDEHPTFKRSLETNGDGGFTLDGIYVSREELICDDVLWRLVLEAELATSGSCALPEDATDVAWDRIGSGEALTPAEEQMLACAFLDCIENGADNDGNIVLHSRTVLVNTQIIPTWNDYADRVYEHVVQKRKGAIPRVVAREARSAGL